MTDRAQQALISIRRVLRATELSARQLSREAGLTVSQLVVLQVLDEAGEATAGSIATRVGLSQATLTALIDKLERRGYVLRKRGETDRRTVWIAIEPAGREALAQAPDTLQDRFRIRFAELPGWEQAYLVAALEKLASLLDAHAFDSVPMLDVGAVERSAENGA